uniref:Uncharacterized protein n=1 Tax=Tanacetum cinerariifolium TaxID=118510 RepID=A0A6L2LHP6_TANCI|nr:hypothetical protein [Tanacetum cinerariifolium]
MNAAQPKRTYISKPAHSYVSRPFQRKSAVRTQFKVPRVSTVNAKFPIVNRKFSTGNSKFSTADLGNKGKAGNSQNVIDDKGYWDSSCSRHMTSNISYLSDYEPYDGGYVSFGQGGGKITGKGIIKTVAKASTDECMMWHRRLGHLNFKTMNKLVRHNLVRGLPFKCFENDHTCVASLKGKHHKASCKTKLVNSVTKPLYTLHMDLLALLLSLIEAARTMLADAKLPVTFWAKAVNTACYVQNRVLVNKSQNKTLYELFNGRTPAIGFLKPFGCHVIILNTLDNLGKFDAKEDEGYFIRYSMSSKAFMVFNRRTKRVEKNLHVNFLENKLIEKGAGPNWLFDIDTLTNSMNYVLVVVAGTTSTNFSGTKDAASQDVKKDVSSLRYIDLPNWFHGAHLESSTSNAQDACNADAPESSENSNPTATSKNPPADYIETLTVETPIPTVSSLVLTACLDDSPEPSSDTRLISKRVTSQEDTTSLDNILNLSNRFEDILGVTTNTCDTNRVEADLGNMENNISASPTPTFNIHKDHQKEEPNKIFDALKDPSWVEAIKKELLQFKIQNVWILVDCPEGVRPIGTKCVLKNKKDERGIMIKNKARLVAQGHTQEEGIDYEEVFVPVTRIEAIRLILAYASFMGFTVYQMDVKSAARVYKVEKAMYGLHQAPKAWYVYVDDIIFVSSNPQLCREFEALMHEKFQMSAMGELNFFLGLQVQQKKDVIFLSQDKYVGDILKKFRYSDVRSANTPMDKENPWGKDRTESSFDLVAYSDSNYGGATQDRKSTSRGCQFLGRRLISWQCKKQTIVATSTTEAEYVAAASGRGQVMWIQNQLLGYGRARIAQSSALPTAADEPASPLGDDSQGEACLTVSCLEAGHDRVNIIKTSPLPHDSTLRATSFTADEGSMQQLNELTDLCTRLQRQQTEMATKIAAQDLEISNLKARIKFLKDKDGKRAEPSREGFWRQRRKQCSPAAEVSTVGIPTGSAMVPTASLIFTTASVVTPYSRHKGKEKMVESDTPKKKKLQEQIDVQVAREIEEQLAREDQRMDGQIARDAEIAKIHAEEELQMLIDGLDRNNETITKYLQEYKQFAADLSIEEKIVLKSHFGWKTKHFKGMTLEEIKENVIPVWKQIEDFVHMASKEEGERVKRKWLRLEQESAKKMKTSEEVSKEDLKAMM